MSPAFSFDARAWVAKLLRADANPAKMLPTKVLRFITPPDNDDLTSKLEHLVAEIKREVLPV
jgi:hypothetical protein